MAVTLTTPNTLLGAFQPKSDVAKLATNAAIVLIGTMLITAAAKITVPVMPVPFTMQSFAIAALAAAFGMRIGVATVAAYLIEGAMGLPVFATGGGLAYLVGAFSGARDILQPLSGLRVTEPGGTTFETPFERVKSSAELDSRIQAAAGRTVMLDFYADWCVSCKEMERYTFSDERVRARFRDMVLLQADVTANNPDDAALLRRFRLFGPPGIVFFDRMGREIPGLRVIGFQPADRFVAVLDQALGREPTLEMAALMAAECQQLLGLLSDAELRTLALLKMEGYTNEEIASRLGCARVTVQRMLNLIRQTWQQESDA